MVQIMGVDFSGAETNNATWVCQGSLDVNERVLTVEQCFRPSRKRDESHSELKKLLLELPKESVAALDFPFSVPERFARFWSPDAYTMPQLWEAASNTDYARFKDVCDEFVPRYGEMLRHGDTYFGGPFSPLKTGGPNMLPMTYYGMKMLHELWRHAEAQFAVPPLPREGRDGPELLETMPGVLLRGFRLPAQNYKTNNKTNCGKPENVRRDILAGLKSIAIVGLTLDISIATCRACIDNADALDALVAAIGGARWAINGADFLHPRPDNEPARELFYARLEGWLYAPQQAE